MAQRRYFSGESMQQLRVSAPESEELALLCLGPGLDRKQEERTVKIPHYLTGGDRVSTLAKQRRRGSRGYGAIAG